MSSKLSLLAIDRGLVIAPAGCGKTQLIANALGEHGYSKPILVLTHTNSGVAALRSRLENASVEPSRYRLSTIDGWAIRLISTFPLRSGHDPRIIERERPSYPAIRSAAAALLKSAHVNDVIAASYSRVLVDEYQDCSLRQHAIVYHAATVLPTCVVGDQAQAIFDFGDDDLADWDDHVCRHFPLAGELSYPWRWHNASAPDLGHWLLEARKKLIAGQPIDLRSAPSEVTWVQLDGSADDYQRMLRSARVRPPGNNGSVLIIGESTSPASQQRFASAIPGAVTVEAVDLRDLVGFSRRLDLTSADVVEAVADFAESLMTNVGATDLVRRVDTLVRGTARREASSVESAAIALHRDPCLHRVRDLLVEINKDAGVRVFRPAVLRACMRALELSCGAGEVSFADAAVRIREQGRMTGRKISGRSVGSTLTLKGLEADVAVVLDASNLNARNLYVAMTRGAKRLIICSRKATLSPSW
jgi:DNA helicase-2/ATP-dependent DNA helicase PcrA